MSHHKNRNGQPNTQAQGANPPQDEQPNPNTLATGNGTGVDAGINDQQANNQLPNQALRSDDDKTDDAGTAGGAGGTGTTPTPDEVDQNQQDQEDEANARTTNKPKTRQRNKKKVEECTACGGTGLQDADTLCKTCDGTGLVDKK